MAPKPPKRPIWKRWWVVALAALLLMGIGAAIAAPASTSKSASSSVPDRYSAPATPEGNQPNTTWPSYSSPPPATQTPEETTPEEPAGPTALKYGAVAVVGSSSESFGMASVKVAAPVPVPADDVFTPETGRYVTTDVTLTGLSGTMHFNALQFKVQTADGRVWQSGLGIKEPDLGYGEVAKGQTVRGWVTFDISTSPVKSVQLYSGGFGGEMLASWTS